VTIEITKNLVGMWQMPFDGGDWLGAVEHKDGEYKLIYRFRYHMDDKVGMESEDKKNWYEGKVSAESDDEIVHAMRRVVQELQTVMQAVSGEPLEVTEILMKDDDVDAFVEELTSQEFAHTQVLDKNKAH
jgi:hypothetical protein